MSTTPTGDLALTLWNLENLIAGSAGFQAECGITTGTVEAKLTAARAFVFWLGEQPPDAKTFAWIRLRNPQTWKREDANAGAMMPKLALLLMLERATLKTVEAKERHIQALNFFGAVIEQIKTASGGAGTLAITNLSLDSVKRSDPKEETAFDQALISVEVW